MTNVEFHLQLNHNETWSMSRLHFHDHFELLLPLSRACLFCAARRECSWSEEKKNLTLTR